MWQNDIIFAIATTNALTQLYETQFLHVTQVLKFLKNVPQ